MTNGPIKRSKSHKILNSKAKKTFREKMLSPERRRSKNVIDARISTAKNMVNVYKDGAQYRTKEVDARMDLVNAGKLHGRPLSNRAKLLHTQVAVKEMMEAAQDRAYAKQFAAEAERVANIYREARLRKALKSSDRGRR